MSSQPSLRLVVGGARAGEPGAKPSAQRDGLLGALALRRSARVDRSLEAAGQRDANRLSVLVLALTCFGTIMVLASSSVASIADYGSPFSVFERQLVWVVIGAIGYLVATRLDLARVRRFASPALVLAAALLLAVLVPHLGEAAGGSSRWIGAGPVSIQPSELAKLAFALFAADLVARRERSGDQLREIVRPLGLVLAFCCILILRQPDMGTAIVLVCIALGVLYAGGVHRRILLGFGGLLLVGGSVLALSASYRRARLLSFINPFGHISTTGYQVAQSLVALGSGHLTGAGQGALASWFLPNAQTDFIFAVVGNDFGVLGTTAVLAAFACIGLLGLRVAARTSDRFSSLLVTAITCWIVLQGLVNIGGVVGALPETGIPLPFFSSGGSSLVVVLIAIGLVVNVARQPKASTERTRLAPAPRRSRPAPARASGTLERPGRERVARPLVSSSKARQMSAPRAARPSARAAAPRGDARRAPRPTPSNDGSRRGSPHAARRRAERAAAAGGAWR